MEAILHRSESPVRQWLDSNSGRVGSFNEDDLLTLIQRNVTESAEIGESAIRGIIRDWAQTRQVTIPKISLVPLTPQQAPAPIGVLLQRPRLDFSIGDFRVNIQLPSEAVSNLPTRLGRNQLLSFRLSAEASGNFTFLAKYDYVPHIHIGLRAGVSVSEDVPFYSKLFIESKDQVCQARNSAKVRESLRSAGNELRDAIRSVQESPTSNSGDRSDDYKIRWTQVGLKISDLYDAIESAKRNECTNQPKYSIELGAKTPLSPLDKNSSLNDEPTVDINAILRF